jgi:hypothetical protein
MAEDRRANASNFRHFGDKQRAELCPERLANAAEPDELLQLSADLAVIATVVRRKRCPTRRQRRADGVRETGPIETKSRRPT